MAKKKTTKRTKKTTKPTRTNGKTFLFSSESVSMGHPDKVSDQVSDAILDAMLEQDPRSRVACETLVTTGQVVVSGEITTKAVVDVPQLVRDTISDIGYTHSDIGFDADSCGILSSIHQQSPDISMGVTATREHEQGAGDQGMMFGFACNETPVLMPLPIYLANKLLERLTRLRETKKLPWVLPDSKSQVTVEYESHKPVRIHTVVVSTQHTPDISQKKIKKEIMEKVILPVLPKRLVDSKMIVHVNPTGRFVVGGPHGDTGLTGRKIIVDTYGGRGRHGGGAFSGKDPSKVDRSAAYMGRYIAKNIVAAKLATYCEVQLAYAIGVAEPVSVKVDTEGTGIIDDIKLAQLVREAFPLTPAGIIRHLKLLRPIYLQTARYGHFGKKGDDACYTWEKTDKAAKLKRLAAKL